MSPITQKTTNTSLETKRRKGAGGGNQGNPSCMCTWRHVPQCSSQTPPSWVRAAVVSPAFTAATTFRTRGPATGQGCDQPPAPAGMPGICAWSFPPSHCSWGLLYTHSPPKTPRGGVAWNLGDGDWVKICLWKQTIYMEFLKAQQCTVTCTATCHKSIFLWNLQEKCRSPEPRPTSSASQRNRNARQHVTRTALRGNPQEKVPQDVTQVVPAQDVKKKHSCETSLKIEVSKCENDAFVRGFPQKVKLASVTKKV